MNLAHFSGIDRGFDRNFRFCPKFPKFSKFSVGFEQGFRPFSLASFANIFGPFSDFRKGTPVVTQVRNENVPEFSFRNFRFRTVFFAKIHRSSKMLTERTALVEKHWPKHTLYLALLTFHLEERSCKNNQLHLRLVAIFQ